MFYVLNFHKYSWKLPLYILKEMIGTNILVYPLATHFSNELPVCCRMNCTPFLPSAGLIGNCYKRQVSKLSASFLLGNFLLPPTWIEFNTWVAKRSALCPPCLWDKHVEERRQHGVCTQAALKDKTKKELRSQDMMWVANSNIHNLSQGGEYLSLFCQWGGTMNREGRKDDFFQYFLRKLMFLFYG